MNAMGIITFLIYKTFPLGGNLLLLKNAQADAPISDKELRKPIFNPLIKVTCNLVTKIYVLNKVCFVRVRRVNFNNTFIQILLN